MAARLAQTGRRRTATLLVTDDRLIEERRAGRDHWRQGWALKNLSPDFDLVSGRPEHARARLLGGQVVAGTALTVFFSTLDAHAPLLAPLPAVAGSGSSFTPV
ncbi:MAG TPA: hypothetical protein VHF87_04010 [Methylomirabilota bacterium]|jgi:hypothetical protein|nr:hypothetical protein [Methylomirabilota bacterium]